MSHDETGRREVYRYKMSHDKQIEQCLMSSTINQLEDNCSVNGACAYAGRRAQIYACFSMNQSSKKGIIGLDNTTVNRRRLVTLASDVTEYVIVHFLFWSCDEYHAWILKSHITNNNIITVFADLRTVFSQLILLSKLLTT